jgi:hypothetical protein
VMLELTTGFELLVPMLYVTAIAMLTSHPWCLRHDRLPRQTRLHSRP